MSAVDVRVLRPASLIAPTVAPKRHAARFSIFKIFNIVCSRGYVQQIRARDQGDRKVIAYRGAMYVVDLIGVMLPWQKRRRGQLK